jgi:hypothetical protein
MSGTSAEAALATTANLCGPARKKNRESPTKLPIIEPQYPMQVAEFWQRSIYSEKNDREALGEELL